MTLITRFTRPEDAPLLTKWLFDPDILSWFPMFDLREVEDAVRIWMSYAPLQASLTAEWDGVPCGMLLLYIQPYKKYAHQCLFSIVVAPELRGKGVGTKLIQDAMTLAKEKFHIELLHLEVYEGNPAIRLYRKMGFTEFGRHEHFVKENGGYRAKIFMQKDL